MTDEFDINGSDDNEITQRHHTLSFNDSETIWFKDTNRDNELNDPNADSRFQSYTSIQHHSDDEYDCEDENNLNTSTLSITSSCESSLPYHLVQELEVPLNHHEINQRPRIARLNGLNILNFVSHLANISVAVLFGVWGLDGFVLSDVYVWSNHLVSGIMLLELPMFWREIRHLRHFNFLFFYSFFFVLITMFFGGNKDPGNPV